MNKKKKIKITNPFRFLTFLLVSLVLTTTLVTQTVKLFATGKVEQVISPQKEDVTVEEITSIQVQVPEEAKANTNLYKTVKESGQNIASEEVDLIKNGVLSQEKLLITLDKVEWFKSEENSSKQGLAIVLNLENKTSEPLVVGRYIGDLIQPTLTYGDVVLKAYSQGMDGINGNVYGFTSLISNFKNYQTIQANNLDDLKTCDASITLEEGAADKCYLVYDYAGLGEYQLSFKVNENKEEYSVLMVEPIMIKEENEQ